MSNATKAKAQGSDTAQNYQHDNPATQRPEAGLQQEFLKQRRPPKAYRYDSSLDPALSWDENPGREQAEWLLGLIERCAMEGETAVFASEQLSADGRIRVGSLASCVARLKDLSKPFLDWAGKAERADIEVPTLPLFVHERHSTKAIIDGLLSHKAKGSTLDLFGDPQLDLTDKLRAYEHKGPWVNRMILGDSLVVMNSLLQYEGMGGQVQMIYIDPPYGVKFGSNFQPFVRNKPGGGSAKDVKHGADEAMTREPEMVKAYRDTWELGLHSYLTYLRDRLLMARELLTESGSVFVQISDENLHRVRALMDEVFGADNFCSVIGFQKTGGAASSLLPTTVDYLIWFAKNKASVKYRQLFLPRQQGDKSLDRYDLALLPDGASRRLARAEIDGAQEVVGRRYQLTSLISDGSSSSEQKFKFQETAYQPKTGSHWKTSIEGMGRLAAAGRIEVMGSVLRYRRFVDDFPVVPITDRWESMQVGTSIIYVVQTAGSVIQRCILMSTDPGDLVLDPTCGSGTTAYVAEQWGRRWITVDTSRVPLALARQRLLTATFPFYELQNPAIGPRGGFVYKRKQNKKGEEVGGLVPHITLKSIANNEEPVMEVLVDRPEQLKDLTRVAGPFVVEALMPAAIEVEESGPATPEHTAAEPGSPYGQGSHIDRMLRVLKLSRTLRLPENRTLVFEQVQALGGFDYLHAEALEQNGTDKRVAIVFAPEDGAIGSETVYAAAEEARDAAFAKLYFFGFAIQAKAREMIEDRSKKKLPCTFITVTPDVLMSDLLKTTRASEIFSVTGLPDVEVSALAQPGPDGAKRYRVKLKGLDVFNPATLETEAVEGENLPCWMLDTDYDGYSFFATQVFFPRTGAWDNLQKSLKAQFEPGLWEHLAGTESEPFELGTRRRIAVKVIDERGNELMVVREVST